MLDFCAEHNSDPHIEMTSMQGINEAWERVVKSDVKYLFVIDLATLKTPDLRPVWRNLFPWMKPRFTPLCQHVPPVS